MAKKDTASITMRVRIGENELEVTGPMDFVEKKIAEFREEQKATYNVASEKSHLHPVPQNLPVSNKRTSMAQFFKQISPKSDVDRVLAAGYFIERFENEEKFTAAEVAKAIQRDAKTKPPINPNASVNKNIKKGYMMAAGDKEGKMAFVLTTDGEETIEAMLNT